MHRSVAVVPGAASRFSSTPVLPTMRSTSNGVNFSYAKLGFTIVPVDVPEFTTDVSAINVESATFFDGLMRSGRDALLTNPGRANGWKGERVLPAVEYLQSQRIRMMMMMKLAEATKHVDVYLGPSNGGAPAPAGGPGGPGRGPWGPGPDGGRPGA